MSFTASDYPRLVEGEGGAEAAAEEIMKVCIDLRRRRGGGAEAGVGWDLRVAFACPVRFSASQDPRVVVGGRGFRGDNAGLLVFREGGKRGLVVCLVSPPPPPARERGGCRGPIAPDCWQGGGVGGLRLRHSV